MEDGGEGVLVGDQGFGQRFAAEGLGDAFEAFEARAVLFGEEKLGGNRRGGLDVALRAPAAEHLVKLAQKQSLEQRTALQPTQHRARRLRLAYAAGPRWRRAV